MGHLFKESDLFFDWYLPLFFNKKKVSNIKNKSKKILFNLYKKIIFQTHILFIEIIIPKSYENKRKNRCN